MRHLLLSSLAALTLALGGCTKGAADSSDASGGKDKYGFVTNAIADFWTIGAAGVKKAAKDLDVHVEISMATSKGGASDQKNAMEDMVTQGVKGIAISPIDPANQTDLLNKIAEQTILLTHDSDAPASKRRCYIGVDNYEAGRQCGNLVKSALPNGGTVMMFIGNLGQDNSQGRRQGVIDVLMGNPADKTRRTPNKYPIVSKDGKYTILGCMTDDMDVARAKANAEDALTKHGDIGCMVGLFEYNPPVILEALDKVKKLGQVKVVGFDENSATLQGVRDGTVVGTIVQNPYMYGYESVRLMVALAKGDASVIPKGGFLNIPARVIDKSKVDAFEKELKQRLGK